MIIETIKRVDEEYATHRHDLHQSYALLKLHFKPDDPDFQPIETIFSLIVNNNKRMAEEENNNAIRELIRNENNDHAKNIIEKGRGILKTEWERVKVGEKPYQIIKYAAILMVTVSIIVAIYYVWTLEARTVENNKHNAQSFSRNEIKIDTPKCWQLQSFKESFFKLNTCTGELTAIDMVQSQK